MATYPNVNAANQYARDIVGGKILACQLTILACQRHLDDLERAKDPMLAMQISVKTSLF